MNALFDAAGILLALLLALALLRVGTVQFALVAPADAEAVPILRLVAIATGVLVGAALLICGRDAAAFLPSRLFAPTGPWQIDLGEFLRYRAFPGQEPLLRARDALLGSGGTVVVAATRLAALGLLAGFGVALAWWRGPARLHAVQGFVVLAFWTALFVHYAVQVSAWTATKLDFWLFLVALVLFQRWRYREPALSGAARH